MSRQQSNTLDLPEQPRHSGGSRKAKPWVLWMLLPAIGRRTKAVWWRRGRYATKEVAQTAAEKNSFVHFERRVMHEDEGMPL